MEDVGTRPQRRDVHEHGEHHHHHPVAVDEYDLKQPHDSSVPNGADTANDTLDSGMGLNTDAFTKADKAMIEAGGIERDYEEVVVPAWRDQLTFRALFVSLILGIIFCIITHRLNLTVGVIPSLNVSAGLLGFLFVKIYTSVATWCGFKVKPFTRQENTVIQTCVVACYGLAFSGGFGSYLLGMSSFARDSIGDVPGNSEVKEPSLSWIFPYILVIALLGIFVLVPLRKVMIIDYKLTYPSGTATAVLINSFHNTSGAALARKQVIYLTKYVSFSFLWSCFKWFFSGDDCGFDTFPSLGIKAYQNRFLFDFNMTYVGAGMICPHLVNCSILFGAIVSWGIMWPLIQNQAGHWYDAAYQGSNFRGLFGYKVFISIALILGDGLYHFVRVTLISIRGMYLTYRARNQLPTSTPAEKDDVVSHDERLRNEVFLNDGVPYWFALAGYITLAIVAIIVVPKIFPSVKWYYLLVGYCIGPVFAFSNAYGAGLTDWNLASNYGKIFLFIFATLAGSRGGIIAGLASCGVAMTIVASASDLMQDFKTGYLTLSSPRSMFVSQLIGGIMGIFVAPSTFWMFYKAFNIGSPGSIYQAPFAVIYRAMALVGVEGFGALPKHCLQLCAGWFAFAIVVNFIRERMPKKYSQYIPLPMAMAIPFYLGAYFAIDMFVGTCIVFVWQRVNRRKADTFTAAVASGLICGDGLWTIPVAILTFAKVNPPICMAFFPTKVATQLGLPLYTN
ncbi:unnamed protein product [Calypogeia fissa]